MSNNESPINAPVPTSKAGRPLTGKEARVARNASVDARTSRFIDINLARLRTEDPDAKQGQVLDRMAKFCARFGFNVLHPNRKPQAEVKPATASIPSPAQASPATSGKA